MSKIHSARLSCADLIRDLADVVRSEQDRSEADRYPVAILLRQALWIDDRLKEIERENTGAGK